MCLIHYRCLQVVLVCPWEKYIPQFLVVTEILWAHKNQLVLPLQNVTDYLLVQLQFSQEFHIHSHRDKLLSLFRHQSCSEGKPVMNLWSGLPKTFFARYARKTLFHPVLQQNWMNTKFMLCSVCNTVCKHVQITPQNAQKKYSSKFTKYLFSRGLRNNCWKFPFLSSSCPLMPQPCLDRNRRLDSTFRRQCLFVAFSLASVEESISLILGVVAS